MRQSIGVHGETTGDDGRDAPPAIVLRDLTYSYLGGQPALRRVNLTILRGERVALVGPNGAGKSTLLLHLNGILQGQGTVQVAGLTLNPHTKRTIRALVGLVFQDPDDQLFSLSVLDDVAFGPLQHGLADGEARNRALEALEQVGMVGQAQRPPQQLSLGERKRVAIATVLALRPAILALDEPTAGLDPRARRQLVALLREMPQTMLVATHDMRLVAELCSRMVIMDEGTIVADGPTENLLADADLLEAHGLESPLVAPSLMAESYSSRTGKSLL